MQRLNLCVYVANIIAIPIFVILNMPRYITLYIVRNSKLDYHQPRNMIKTCIVID